MSKALSLTRQLTTLLILLIIGGSLIGYYIYSKFQHPAPPAETYYYAVTIYDQAGAKIKNPSKDLIVNLKGIDNNFNSTLNSPNFQNTTYYFKNLTAGNYALKIYSSNFNLLLYNKTFFLNKDTAEEITIPAQPLSISVMINGSISKLAYQVLFHQKERNLNFSSNIKPQQTLSLSAIPTGNYSITLLYLSLPINQTNINLNGTITFIEIKTSIVNATFKLFDQRMRLLNNTSMYIIYEGKSIGPYVSKNGVINATNIPPLNLKLVFNYRGINVTVNEETQIDFSKVKNNAVFNFTLSLTNSTFLVKYDNGFPAKGIKLYVFNSINGTTDEKGEVTFKDLPAKTNLLVTAYRSNIMFFKENVTLKTSNNTIEIIITKYSIRVDLVPKFNVSNFNTFFMVQDQFNKSNVLTVYSNSLNVQLYPGTYKIFAYLESRYAGNVLVYQALIGLNKTFVENVTVPVGFTINASSGIQNATFELYYVDYLGEHLVESKAGQEVSFSNLIAGDYKIVLMQDGKYLSSSFISISRDSPQTFSISFNTQQQNPLVQDFQYGLLIMFILLILIVLTAYLIRLVIKKKQA